MVSTYEMGQTRLAGWVRDSDSETLVPSVWAGLWAGEKTQTQGDELFRLVLEAQPLGPSAGLS